MSAARVLVAGVGNIFRGDDAFGVEVVRRLRLRGLPPSVTVIDFGVRGYDLAYALMEGYNRAILVDAFGGDGGPGTLYTVEPDLNGLRQPAAPVEPHRTDLYAVIALIRALGGSPPPLTLVGCAPAFLGSAEEGAMGLSPAVLASVDPAVELVEALVAEALADCSNA